MPEYPHTMRLQRFLARAGVSSRRGSERLMSSGRVQVNGKVCKEMGQKVDCEHDVVVVDGKRVMLSANPVYLILNKPAGYLTTMHDPYQRKCVASLVPVHVHPGLFPVGRLDKDTTGLLLFTTDGDMAQRLLHPSFEKEKTYVACVEGKVVDTELDALRHGIELDDGPCAPARVEILSQSSNSTQVQISIHEGRKHIVKRMFAAISHPVTSLKRIAFATLRLTGLDEGHWRYLTQDEIDALKDCCLTG